MTAESILGIDIGGTGIKGAPVDVRRGVLRSERFRLKTPHPATPDAVAAVVADVAAHFEWTGNVGICFPAAVKRGVTLSAANVDPAWIDHDASRTFRLALRCATTVINDADAAGLAEMRYGAGVGEPGTVIMVTLGTGVGISLFHGGVLFPNAELGHLVVRGKEAELRVSDAARDRRGDSWKKWSRNLTEYLTELETLLHPDLFIIGGGAIKQSAEFMSRLHTNARLAAAVLGNDAGIIGAALNCAVAGERHVRRSRGAAVPSSAVAAAGVIPTVRRAASP